MNTVTRFVILLAVTLLCSGINLTSQEPGTAQESGASAPAAAASEYLYANNNETVNGTTVFGIAQYNTTGIVQTRFMPTGSPFFIVAKSGNIFVDPYFTVTGQYVQGVGLFTPGSTTATEIVSQQAIAGGSVPRINPLAVSASETNIFIQDQDQKTGIWGVYEYAIATKKLLRIYPSIHSPQFPASIAIDGNGHLWVAWYAQCCSNHTLAEYTQTSITPIMTQDIPTPLYAVYVDRQGGLWSLQNGDYVNTPDYRYFLPGMCAYDPNGPKPGDDVRTLLMQRFYKGTTTLYFSTPSSSVGDGDGDIRYMAVAPNGYAYLAYDTSNSTQNAGVTIYPLASGSGPVCPEATHLTFPFDTNPAVATDKKSQLYVGVAGSTKTLYVYTAGGSPALIHQYPGDFAGNLAFGGALVVR